MTDFVRITLDGERVSVEDSMITEYTRTTSHIRIIIRLWNARVLALTIDKMVGVQDVLAGDLSAIKRIDVVTDGSERPSGGDPFVQTACAEAYGGRAGTLTVYEFIDPDDRVALRVITEPEPVLTAEIIDSDE